LPTRANIEARIAQLEAQYGSVGVGQFNPLRNRDPLERGAVLVEAINRLSSLEFHILEELLEKRERHGDMSGAEFFSVMSKTEHAFELEWIKVCRSIVRERAGEVEEDTERSEELRRRVVEDIEETPPPWWCWND
jgi:hypothetical protein